MNALISDSSPIKLLPLSDISIFTCPILSINWLRADLNDSVVRYPLLLDVMLS